MEMRNLGATGMKVSSLCLGTMMFGPMGNPDREDCVRIIHRAFDAGINFVDTADVYSQGVSEEIVGAALKSRRDDIVVATKFFNPMGTDPNRRGGSRRWIEQAVDDSLRRLGIDYIDLYQMHRWDAATDIDDTLFTLTELVRKGKIRSFGSSMFPADRIVEAQWVADRRNYLPFRCEQSVYSMFNRDIERFVLPACTRHGMGMIVWSPLDGGFLSGKYKASADFTDNSRIVNFSKRFTGTFDAESEVIQRKLALIPQLEKLAGDAGITLAQMAVGFTTEHPAVTSAIIGPRTMEHLETLLDAGDLKLDSAVLDAIDTLCPPGTSLNPLVDLPSGTGKDAIRRG
ncbi:MAG: aldo/keto reductase [Candidatus Andeanibacterium colombiense]|uniref:Aldo/keto reductase n=1 Tax=Candidatus Andeanibacterium colombiense TaxID=3121345 RepID=A0AAJ6BND5_9SPHN|nr:MAG: aldo/keto reductase [Sphingomonadaceae bacterium]